MSDTLPPFDAQQALFIHDKGVRRIFDVIAKAGGEARVVGGAVRDALLGRAVAEVDFAVNLSPQKVMEILEAAEIKVVPTGIDHGTVTAVINHKGYELTTLRQDVETDGRHAKVAFTDNWQADAARRDFTFNALYADASGKIYDYFDGRKDLAEGRVRFIGDASARIKEDVLRILRFFRFQAWFGRGLVDETGLSACCALANLIPQLSVERVWREITKLLAADNPLRAWVLMKDSGVLAHVLPEAKDVMRLEALLNVERKAETPPAALVRLVALLPKKEAVALQVAQKMKLSKREAEKLQMLATLPDRLNGKLDPVPFRRALYEYGAEYAHDAALLHGAEDKSADLETALSEAAQWEKPIFPVQGDDILKLGIAAGPRVGEILRAVEEWWMAQDFRANREECLAEAKHRI